MILSITTTRKLLIGIFTILSLLSLTSTFYVIPMTVFGIGWGDGDTTMLEVLWMWKGIIILTVFAILTTIGLIREKKLGVIFGFVIALSLLVYFIIIFVVELFIGTNINLTDFIITTGFISASFILLHGLTKLKKTFQDLLLKDYLFGTLLTVILLLSFLAFFFE